MRGNGMVTPPDFFSVILFRCSCAALRYTADEALFFADFASAFGKLLALGCPGSAGKAAATAGEQRGSD